MDFGLLFQRYEAVTNAAREGARVAVLPGYAQADVQARVTQYLAAAGLNSTPTFAYTAPQAVNVGGACMTITGVTVGYPHQYLFLGKIIGLFGGSGFTTKTADRHRTDALRRRGRRLAPLAASTRGESMNRTTRTVVVMAVATVTAAVASLGVYAAVKRIPVREVEVAHTFVAVAARNLPTGSRSPKKDVKLVAWPASTRCPGASPRSKRSWTAAWSPPSARTSRHREQARADRGGRRPAAVDSAGHARDVGEGRRSGRRRRLRRAGHARRPGRHAARDGSQTEEPMSRTVVSNVLVLTAGTSFDQEQAKDGKPQPSTVVTLAVTPRTPSASRSPRRKGRSRWRCATRWTSTPTETAGVQVDGADDRHRRGRRRRAGESTAGAARRPMAGRSAGGASRRHRSIYTRRNDPRREARRRGGSLNG